MRIRRLRILGALAAIVTAGVLLPAGTALAVDGHQTDGAGMPGGAGSISCTTDYHVYNDAEQGKEVRPFRTDCTNPDEQDHHLDRR